MSRKWSYMLCGLFLLMIVTACNTQLEFALSEESSVVVSSESEPQKSSELLSLDSAVSKEQIDSPEATDEIFQMTAENRWGNGGFLFVRRNRSCAANPASQSTKSWVKVFPPLIFL